VVPLRRKYLVWLLATAATVVALLFGIAAYALRSGALKPRVISALSDALNCDVSLDSLDVQLVPVIRVTGTNLSVRLRDRPGLPPFVAAERFTFNLGLLSVLRRHIETIHMEGLVFNVPPRWSRSMLTADDSTGPATAPIAGRPLYRVDHVVANDARLHFVRSDPQKLPLEFAIHHLEMFDVGTDVAMHFTSRVTNPMPEGLVNSTGTFGPWNRVDPTETALAGNFTLADGNLATLNGIAGMTSATGVYRGVLADIRVEGTSQTPDFSLDLGGKPMPVSTKFIVTVDGTNGTTRFDRIEAQLVDTPVLVTGIITNLPGPKNVDVTLAVRVDKGRIEDLLKLAIDAPQPVLTGQISMTATVLLPPGPTKARERARVMGSFGVGGGRFTGKDLQAQLVELSRRGQGKDKDEMVSRIATNVTGQFSVAGGVASFSQISFVVPGAAIALKGEYTMGSELVNFTGTARLDASLSQAVGGFKSIFIKPFNPLFRKNGAGAVLPIEITGTRDQPKFKVKLRQGKKKET
jgi:uncharacterized protein involved in outer membrane biogenesis